MPRSVLLAAALALPFPLAAQTGSGGAVEALTDPAAITDAAASAAQTLEKSAKGHLLVAEMLGSEIAGPSGDTLGTLENLVVIPGGKIVAAIVKPKQGDPIALPYQALKVSAAASAGKKTGLTLPIELEKARGMSALQDLTAAVLGDGG